MKRTLSFCLAQMYANTNTHDLANRYVSADQRATLTDYPWPENENPLLPS